MALGILLASKADPFTYENIVTGGAQFAVVCGLLRMASPFDTMLSLLSNTSALYLDKAIQSERNTEGNSAFKENEERAIFLAVSLLDIVIGIPDTVDATAWYKCFEVFESVERRASILAGTGTASKDDKSNRGFFYAMTFQKNMENLLIASKQFKQETVIALLAALCRFVVEAGDEEKSRSKFSNKVRSSSHLFTLSNRPRSRRLPCKRS